VANKLVIEDGVLTGEVVGPLVRQNSKKDALEAIAKRWGIRPKDCVVIGDGANDISMFEASGFSIAFNANPILYDIADVIITKKDLSLILHVVRGGAYAEGVTREENAAKKRRGRLEA
jgi:phosphoserine phosphatase